MKLPSWDSREVQIHTDIVQSRRCWKQRPIAMTRLVYSHLKCSGTYSEVMKIARLLYDPHAQRLTRTKQENITSIWLQYGPRTQWKPKSQSHVFKRRIRRFAELLQKTWFTRTDCLCESSSPSIVVHSGLRETVEHWETNSLFVVVRMLPGVLLFLSNGQTADKRINAKMKSPASHRESTHRRPRECQSSIQWFSWSSKLTSETANLPRAWNRSQHSHNCLWLGWLSSGGYLRVAHRGLRRTKPLSPIHPLLQ